MMATYTPGEIVNGRDYQYVARHIRSLTEAINAHAAKEMIVASNTGTFSAEECCRKTGCGESVYGEYVVYMRLSDGARRTVGCDPSIAPGWERTFDARAARAAHRRQTKALIDRLEAAKAWLRKIEATTGSMMPYGMRAYLAECVSV